MAKYPKFEQENKNFKTTQEILELMPLEIMKKFRAFVVEQNEKETKIASADPDNKELKDYAKDHFGKKIKWFSATEESINLVVNKYANDYKNIILQLSQTALETNNNIVTIVDNIIKFALGEQASDIHIEPLRNETAVRFRIDGVLHTVLQLPKSIHTSLIARFKIISNLKIDEYRRPQDGRIEPEEFQNVSLRVSVMPTLFGEKIALRVLDESNKNISIDELGFSEKQKKLIVKNTEKPFGMIVSSGPTGSGKTTTLYALLQLLKKDGINISTLEDPIEYTLPGVNQIQVNPRFDLTFASGLRSLLRQDPNIIMVGEIRDAETAEMAANAAMTGHLVFTTIHTNDAASAFTRFLEMGIDDFVVSGTINLVIAQRLIRKICSNCAIKQKLDPIIVNKISERTDVISALEVKQKGSFKNIKQMEFVAGKGCEKCYHTGYSGRIGLYEILTPTKEIQDAILSHKSSDQIKTIALSQGFEDMVTDGINKIFEEKTTFEEVLRITKNI